VLGSIFSPGSYLGIFVFLVLTGCGLPIPEEAGIVVAGVLSSQGNLQVGPALAVCIAGALLGDCVIYAIGYRWGPNLLSYHPRLAKLLGAEREASFEEAIERHAFKVLLLARFVVGIRAPVYLAAGVVRMPFRRFVMYDILAVVLVVGFFFGLSYAFGDEVLQWIRRAEITLTIAVIAAVVIVGFYLYRYQRSALTRWILGSEPPQG
jgi:membrane protein DedA with SNARE-associated domain